MSGTDAGFFIDDSLLELFRTEVETHSRSLETGLVALEADQSPARVEPLMRAAHSIKGAARIVGLNKAVALAHVMEDVLSESQKGRLRLTSQDIDKLLKGGDFFSNLAGRPLSELSGWLDSHAGAMEGLVGEIRAILDHPPPAPVVEAPPPAPPPAAEEGHRAAGVPDAGFFVDESLLDLFRTEVETHARSLETGLVALEADQSPARVEPLMRAAHSIKGAARIVGLNKAVALAHVMEDALSASQKGLLRLTSQDIDKLLKGGDFFAHLAGRPLSELSGWLDSQAGAMEGLVGEVRAILEKPPPAPAGAAPPVRPVPEPPPAPRPAPHAEAERPDPGFVRVQSDRLNRLMGLAGECLVQARSVNAFASVLQTVKMAYMEIRRSLDRLKETMVDPGPLRVVDEALDRSETLKNLLPVHLERFDRFSRRLETLADRLYGEVVDCRMRPFSEGVQGFPRLVRDVAKSLGKKVELRFAGEQTPVDRDILEKLEAPLNHLLRNALDHGVELPEERVAAGKSPQGVLVLEAGHRAGMLRITVSDDGRGIDPEKLRAKVVEKGYVTRDMAAGMSRPELMDFLFLPGFTTTTAVTEISGRGVGLDVVHSMTQAVGGTVRVDSKPGEGTQFEMILPLTLSVLNALTCEIAGEPYAVPLSRIDRLLELDPSEIRVMEDRQFYLMGEEAVGVVDAARLLKLGERRPGAGKIPMVLVSDRIDRFGLAVDKLTGECSLVLIPLDPRLGKVPNISSGAVMEDGRPILVLDVDDLVRSIHHFLETRTSGHISKSARSAAVEAKTILVVDDSLTVREVERKLLENKGYKVTLAVDGMDGWNKLQEHRFNMVLTDVDMPRMNGIELVGRIKRDPRYRALPVMIVSYKDREEDKMKGLEAGADYYLTKSGFHDARLLEAVRDLIGEAAQ